MSMFEILVLVSLGFIIGHLIGDAIWGKKHD